MNEPIGEYLARQRQLRGITLDELAAITRLPRRSLDRLEHGAFDGVPDGFARGFVRTVAEALGLEPDDTVNRMLPEPVAVPPRRRIRSWVWVVGGAAAAILVLLPLLAPRLQGPAPGTRSGPARAEGADREVVLRRDPVKLLAESVGAWAPRRVAGPAAALARDRPER